MDSAWIFLHICRHRMENEVQCDHILTKSYGLIFGEDRANRERAEFPGPSLFFAEMENKFTNHLHKIADIEVDFSFDGTTMGSVRGVRT